MRCSFPSSAKTAESVLLREENRLAGGRSIRWIHNRKVETGARHLLQQFHRVAQNQLNSTSDECSFAVRHIDDSVAHAGIISARNDSSTYRHVNPTARIGPGARQGILGRAVRAELNPYDYAATST